MKKTISYILGACTVLALVLGITYRHAITQYVVAYAVKQIEEHSGYHIQCGDVEFSFPFNLHIACVKVISDNKPLAFVDRLEVKITPWGVLQRHIVIDSVKIETLSLLAADNTSSEPLSWNSIPGHFKVNALQIEKLHIQPDILARLHLSQLSPFVSREMPMRLSGVWMIDPFARHIFCDVSVSETVQPENKTHVIATLEQKEDILSAHVRINEGDHSLIAEQLNFPHGYQFQVILDAQVSVKSLPALLSQNEKFSEDDLKGHVQISYENTQQPVSGLGAYGFLKSDFKLTPGGRCSCPNIEGLIGNILLNGTVVLTSEWMCDGTALRLSAQQLNHVSGDLCLNAKELEINCTLSGHLLSPKAILTLAGRNCAISNWKAETIAAQATAHYDGNAISGILNLDFKENNSRLNCSTSFAWNHERRLIGFHDLHATAENTSIQGDLQLDLPFGLITGNISGTSDLKSLSTFFNKRAEGKGVWKAHFYYQIDEETQATEQVTQLDIDIANALFENHQVENLHIDATIDSLLTHPSGLIRFSCAHASLNDWAIVDISGETVVNPAIKRWPFALTLSKDSVMVNSKGSWHFEDDLLEGRLENCEGLIADYAFKLSEPIEFRKQSKNIQFSPLSITLDAGRGLIALNLKTDSPEVLVQWDHLPLDLITLFYPDKLAQGNTSGSLSLKEHDHRLEGTLNLNLNDIGFTLQELNTPKDWNVALKADLHNDVILIHGQATELTPIPLNLFAALPVLGSLKTGEFSLDDSREFFAQLQAQGKIESLLEHILPVTTTNLTGQATLSVNASGYRSHPQFNGHAAITGGTFEILDMGAYVDQLHAEFVLNGSELRMTNFQAVGDESGTIAGSGSVALDLDRQFPFDFAFQLNNLGMRPFNYAFAAASGLLKVHGNTQEGLIEGKLSSDQLQITIPKKIPELTEAIEVTYVNQPPHLSPPTVFVKQAVDWPLRLNVELEIPGHAIVSGKDWASEWKGTAMLTGEVSHFLVNGTYRIVKGEYTFNGKKFEINQGSITFAGEPEKKNSIYVIASRDIDSTHIEAILKGDLAHPAVSFRSNPPMSQREILSRILFNSGTSEISTFQGTQLNDSITDLNTNNRQTDVLTKIRDEIGIDKIGITNDDHGAENAVSFQVGKYISKGVLVSIQKSITAEANRVSIEADLMKNVKVEAQVGDDAAGTLKLKWKRDY